MTDSTVSAVHDVPAVYLPYFWNSQSLLSRGQTWRALSHREMQWKWNACCESISQSRIFRKRRKTGEVLIHCRFPMQLCIPP